MISFFKALMYPYEQRGWFKEIFTAVALASIPIAGYFFIKGWEFEIGTRVRHNAPRVFPGWKPLGKRFERGLLIGFAVILYNIPVYIAIAYTIWLWIGPLIKALTGRINLDLPVVELYKSALGLRLGMILISLILWFFMNSLYWSGYLRYIETRRYALFFDIGTNAIITFTTIADDLIIGVYVFLAQLLAGLIDSGVTAMLVATGIGTILVPFLVPAVNMTFMSMFEAYMFGKLAENTFGEEQPVYKSRRRHPPLPRSELRRPRRIAPDAREDRPQRDRY